MAAKKPSAKATQAKKTAPKKTIAKKPEPAKKAAPAKKSPAPAIRKPAPASTATKAASKAPQKAPHKNSVTPPKSVKASNPSEETAKPAAKAAPAAAKPPSASTAKTASASAAKAAPAPTAKVSIPAAPKTPIPARNLASRAAESENADSDDGDPDALNSNLLAGPRNVKPYIPRRGEQYMNKEQLDHFRNILETWKRDLMQEVDRTVLHMKDEAANFPDPNDRATQESEFSLELRTRDRERKLIRKIEEAIKRIDDGSYGYCNETGEEIGIKRLEARPVATLCLEAQERRERREKQYGDRDDRYR
jgi:DnaK suppressor protein